jgi:hypothetical protein
MSDEYFKYANDNDQRKEVLTDLSRKAFDRINSGRGRSAALLQALGRAAGQHRVLLWSEHPDEQAAVSGTPLAGTVLDVSGPTAAVILNNAGGNKLDYYVDRTLRYEVLRCGDDTRTVRATIRLTNTAPASGLPGIVTVRSDGRTAPPGQSRTFVNYYGTTGSKITAANLDGQPVRLVIGTERNHPAAQATLEIPPGKSSTLVLEMTEPATSDPVTVPVQPLARPMTVQLANDCG